MPLLLLASASACSSAADNDKIGEVAPPDLDATVEAIRAGASETSSDSGVRTVPYSAVCTSCRIDLDLVATLGRAGDTIGPSTVHADIARDAAGRFFTWSYNRRAILVYRPDGVFERTIARAGDGPGEIPSSGTRLVLGRGDSLIAFMRNRFTVFAPDGRAARDVSLPGGTFGPPVPLPDGRMVVAASWNRPETVGLGVHVLAPDGSRTHSFAGDGSYDVRCLQCMTNRVAAAGRDSSHIWLVPPNSYEIRSVSLAGRVVSVLRVTDSWLVTSQDSMRPNVPILAIREDMHGLLWLFGVLREASARQGGGIKGASDSVRAAAAKVRTVIDVIDPVSGALLVTATMDGLYHPFGDQYAAHLAESERGENSLEVFRTFIRVH